MATGASLVSVEEYLGTNYKPACEYVDGVLRRKSMPTRKHGRLQLKLGFFLERFSEFEAGSEVTCQIRTGKFLVPDLIVQRRDRIQDPYPMEPVHLCIEILSPADRLSEVLAKCEDYLDWGVESTWVIDPEMQRAWEYRKPQQLSEVPPSGSLVAEGIEIPLAQLFSEF